MNANDPRLLDSISWDLLFADAPRSANRALIDALADGAPPFTDSEVSDNAIAVNFNDLSLTKALHSARTQFANGFLKTGNYFRCTTDSGPRHKREKYSSIVTQTVNKRLKRSTPYFESYRSRIGSLCLHGIAPNVWENEDKWCPRSLGVGDVLIPSGTRLGFENLPFFFLRRSFTGIELAKLTQAEKCDPGWNMPFVKRCLAWIEEQSTTLRGNYWPDSWSPERVEQSAKENNGSAYANDRAPVISTFDVYIWNDSKGEQGWVRRIILDAWSQATPSGSSYQIDRRSDMKDLHAPKDRTTKPSYEEFLFDSKDRKVAHSWEQLMSFQFADLSAVAPFRYHSVRSLGFLLYGACTINNRLNCKFTEAVFETLMMMFRVKSMEDVQRVLKLNLYNRGFLDESVNPIPAEQRWQPNVPLVQLMQQQLREMIDSGTGTFAQRRDFSPDKVEKTRFQVMAEVNADSALVGAALSQAYKYQGIEDTEVLRRFFKVNSTDPDVRAARNDILRQGVPESLLVPEAWEVEHEQILGNGGKTQELQATQQLLEMYQLYDPSAQRHILREATLAITESAAKSELLVPEQPEISNSVHDAELSFTTLMAAPPWNPQSPPLSPKRGLNGTEVAATIIGKMQNKVEFIMQTDSMGTVQDVIGLENCSTYVKQYIEQIGADPEAKQISRMLSDALGKLENSLKAMAQRHSEAQQQSAQQNGNGQDPEAMAKIQAMMMQAQAKAQNSRESHAQRTAEKQISFENKLRQEEAKTAQNLKTKARESGLKLEVEKRKAALEISKSRQSKPKP